MAKKKEIWEEHNVLYHYTSEKAVTNILRSQTLWATHYKFLNDPTEIAQMKSVLVKTITPRTKEVLRALQRKSLAAKRKIKKVGGLNAASATFSSKSVEALYRTTFGGGIKESPFGEAYITSFCSHDNDHPYTQENGLLSQWRAYGRNSGCAIIFDCKILTNLLSGKEQNNHYLFGSITDVVYEGDQKKFRDEFSYLLEKIPEITGEMLLGNEFETEDIYNKFVNGASRFKHQAFEEEREVRVICGPGTKEFYEYMRQYDTDLVIGDKPLKKIYRRQGPVNKKVWIPYIKLFESIDDELLPIQKIIIGPGQNQSIIQKRITKTVNEIYGDSKVDVYCSETPFRKQL